MLKGDIGLRLISILLAIVLWLQFVLVSEQRSVVDLPLNLSSLPADITLENIPETIPFAVRGKGMDIIRLLVAKPKVNVDGSNITPNTKTIMLQDYFIDLPENIKLTSLSPAEAEQFSIQADVFHQKTVPVQLDFASPYTRSRLSELRYTINPKQVTIFGPQSKIQGIEHINTAKLHPEDINQSSVELSLQAPSPDITISDTKVLLSISGIQELTKVFPNISLPPGYIPAQIAIRVQAPAAILDTLSPAYLSAFISVAANEDSLFRVLANPPEGIKIIALTPDKVRARK